MIHRPETPDPIMIPKRLIYGWFGGKPKPDKIKYCIDSWARTNPGYELVELNETNTCYLNQCDFLLQAYKAEKWAYVADFFKIVYLYNYGGICLDADVELLKPLEPFLFNHSYFTGQEINHELFVTAVMGARPHHPLVKMFLEYYYTKREFQPIPNTQFLSTITKLFITNPQPQPQKQPLPYFTEHGGIIYPQNTFCPYNHKTRTATPTATTYAIHHFAGSWK